MDWDETQMQVLAAAIGRLIVPTGEAPADWAAVLARRVAKIVDAMPAEKAELFLKNLGSLINESFAIFGAALPDMHDAQKDELITRCYNDQTRGFWPQPPGEFLDQLADLATEAAASPE